MQTAPTVAGQPAQRWLRIAGRTFHLWSDQLDFWPVIRQRYANFEVGAAAQAGETIELRVVETGLLPELQRDRGEVVVDSDADGFEMRRDCIRGSWRARDGEALLEQTSATLAGTHGHYALDGFLRVLLSFRLVDSGGLLVHAAGVDCERRGYLFVGVSGAGKSTIARLSTPVGVTLNDDVTVVRLTTSGAELHGTPFYGENGVPGPNRSVPLAGLYFLQQAPTHRRRRLTRMQALPRLMRSVLFFGNDVDRTGRLLDVACQLLDRVPAYELHFRPEIDVWRHIR